MTFARIKETFLRLPRTTKTLGIAAFLLFLSTLLPWYTDIDSYRVGDEFLGVSGPTSFIGISILIMAGFSIWIFSYHLLERRVPRLPMGESVLNLFVGAESLFLILLVNSIYYHPKFGVNILDKEPRFGMMLSLVSSLVMVIAAYLQYRDEGETKTEEGHLEPLIKLESSSTPVSESKPIMPAPKPASQSSMLANYQRQHQMPLRKPAMQEREMGRSQPPVATPAVARPVASAPVSAPVQQAPSTARPAPTPYSAKPPSADGSDKGSYMIRLDL
ncbi:MAG: hypothetical protein AAB588_05660 [Patescibacteria group bacterium]